MNKFLKGTTFLQRKYPTFLPAAIALQHFIFSWSAYSLFSSFTLYKYSKHHNKLFKTLYLKSRDSIFVLIYIKATMVDRPQMDYIAKHAKELYKLCEANVVGLVR